MDLSAENQRLRAELDAYRQRELAELRRQLAEAREAMEHYRSEAQRNADAAREIASTLQTENAELKGKLQALEQVQTHVARVSRGR